MTQRQTNLAAAILAAAGLPAAALAQDSVSATPGLPGDAVSAYTTGEQVNDYVVDLAERTSSWGGKYLLGPIVKSSQSSTATFFNHLIGAQAVSATLSARGPFVRSSYALWSTPGPGVNSSRNSAPGSVSTGTMVGQTLGTAFLEFAAGPDSIWGTADDENNVVASLISLAPRYPNRVYVSRIVALTNKSSSANANAVLGLGGVDTSGNVHLLADGTGMTGPSTLTGRKLIRVDAAARNAGTVNVLSDTGGADSTPTRVFPSTLITQTTPTIIPKTIPGGANRPVMVDVDLSGLNRVESVANTLATSTAHLGAGVTGRGSVAFCPQVFGPLGAGTRVGMMSLLSRGPSSSKTRGISAWAVTPAGLPTGTLRAEMPTAVGALKDLDDNFDPSSVFGSPENQEFTNFQSQTIYRGANGPAALAVLPGGDLLLAATVAATGNGADVPAGMNNYIAVARVSAANQSVSWTIAAHTGNAAGSAGGLAKAIYGDNGADGRPGTLDAGEGDGVVDGTPIGTLAIASETAPEYSTGPSLSAPAMDRAGNIYFMSHVTLKTQAGGVRHSLSLLRANLNPATNAYRLELITDLNETIAGLNSGKNYQIQFLSVADADSIDSGTVWSGNIVNEPLAGVDVSSLPYGSPLSLGGLVFRAKIVYDTNNDGNFLDPSLPGNSGTDEAYNVQMLLFPKVRVADIGKQGGLPGPDGLYDNNDFVVFINAFFGGDLSLADLGGQGGLPQPDGLLDNNDFVVFIDRFFNQQ